MAFISRHYATVFVLHGHCGNAYYYCIYVYRFLLYRGPQGRIAYVLIVTPSQNNV